MSRGGLGDCAAALPVRRDGRGSGGGVRSGDRARGPFGNPFWPSVVVASAVLASSAAGLACPVEQKATGRAEPVATAAGELRLGGPCCDDGGGRSRDRVPPQSGGSPARRRAVARRA